MHTSIHVYIYVCMYTGDVCVCVYVFNLRTFAPALVFGRDIGNRAVITEKLGVLHQFTSAYPQDQTHSSPCSPQGLRG